MEFRPNIVCSPEPCLNLVEVHGALCQLDLARSAAAAIIEHCVCRLLPPDQDVDSLVHEIRHILESELAVQQWLCHLRNANGDRENQVRSACQTLIQSAAALSRMRGGSTASH